MFIKIALNADNADGHVEGVYSRVDYGAMVIIGAPFDLCGHRTGSRLGPSAIRLAGLESTLSLVNEEVLDEGDISFSTKTGPGLRYFGACLANVQAVKQKVAATLAFGKRPILIGGDHTNGMGTVAGALAHYGDDLAVLWVDAHADLNVPGTSPSGNMHGMSVAALLGRESQTHGIEEEQWRTLLSQGIGDRFLKPSRMGWLGLRDVDAGERKALRELGDCYVATMSEVDRLSMVGCIERFEVWLRGSGAKKLWISFDVDSLDPVLAPGTGTAVRGGLTYREMHLMGEMLSEILAPDWLAGIDIVETNPLVDNNNQTARAAVEWVASLCGKTILGG